MTITATSDNQIRKSNIRNWTIGLQTFATGSLPRSGLVQQQLRTVEAPTVKEFDLSDEQRRRAAGRASNPREHEIIQAVC